MLQREGDGGEGLVYRATGIIDGAERDVALKLLTTLTVDDYERVAARARLMSEIDHPHVMHQVETFVGTALIDTDDPADDEFDVVYTVADWVPGASFAVAVEAAGPVAGLRWVAQIARAVAYLHAFRSPAAPDGVVHRDIKPSNVRIFQDRAVLIDFGVARPHDTSDMTQGVGTYLWRAPETVGGPGQPGPASDAWGVGALGYWVLTGEPPRLEAVSVARERMTAVARDLQLRDADELGRHLSSLLETHPDDRPADLDRWADELDALLAPRRTGRRPATAARRTSRRRRGVLVGGVLVSALALGAVALAASGGSGHATGHASTSATAELVDETPTTTSVPATTTPPASGMHVRILNARTHEPFAPWANDTGPLLRACPRVGCVEGSNDKYAGADAKGDVVMPDLDPNIEYSFTAMAIDIDGCPPFYENPSNPRNAGHKYWFAPEVFGRQSEVEGTTFEVVDNC